MKFLVLKWLIYIGGFDELYVLSVAYIIPPVLVLAQRKRNALTACTVCQDNGQFPLIEFALIEE